MRLDPDLPICWEDPDTLRLGFDRAVVRLRRPSAGVQRLLGRLITGEDLSRPGILALSVGAPVAEVAAALRALAPALVAAPPPRPADAPAEPPPRPLRAFVSDDGRPVPALVAGLTASGLCVPAPHERATDLVVHVERFLEPLARAQRWLVAGIPHLVVRFTDRAVEVGPLIRAGAPCAACLALARVDADPAAPALAAQLVGVPPRSETDAAAALAAVYAAGCIGDWRAGLARASTDVVALSVSGGRPDGSAVRRTVAPHPECACGAGAFVAAEPEGHTEPAGDAEPVSAGSPPPRRSATADADSAPRPRPRRAAAHPAPA